MEMKYPAAISLVALVTLARCAIGNSLPFRANFSDSPQSFTIEVNKEFIDNTKLKASLTRFVTPIDEIELSDGPPVHNATAVRDYWVNDYDWYSIQKRLNQK
jgi:Epoxide hydrolase N terminus